VPVLVAELGRRTQIRISPGVWCKWGVRWCYQRWQTAGLLKVNELLGGVILKMFTDKVELGLDDELIKRLVANR